MNHMTSGASNDIERATDIAQHMVCEWGMSDLGPLAFRKPGNAFDADRPHAISEATAQRVDEEIRKIVMGGYDRATTVSSSATRPIVRLLDGAARRRSRSRPTRSRHCSRDAAAAARLKLTSEAGLLTTESRAVHSARHVWFCTMTLHSALCTSRSMDASNVHVPARCTSTARTLRLHPEH